MAKVDALAAGGADDLEIPAFLRRQSDLALTDTPSDSGGFTPDQLLKKFNELSLTSTNFSDIARELRAEIPEGSVLREFAEDQVEARLACLLDWLSKRVQGIPSLTRHSRRLLNVQLAKIDPALIQKAQEQLDRAFSSISKTSWGDN
jgi:hypothetical protein